MICFQRLNPNKRKPIQVAVKASAADRAIARSAWFSAQ
jgi:hypothetical protein